MRDFNRDMIQVLWVEDDPNVTETYPLEAENFDLELIPFSNWDEAKHSLENDFDRWSAIILDAKCKQHRDSKDNAIRFLGEALKDISVISEKKARIIPWYILTGGEESDIVDSINDDRLKWDEDWTKGKNKKYYSKNVDREDLFRRIRHRANKSYRLQIQEMYRNVFDAIAECGIDDEAYNAMEDLLIPIHFEVGNEHYNDSFKKGRIVLEYIFRSMIDNRMLPLWGNEVNLRWSSCILSGKDALDKEENIVVKCHEQILPVMLSKMLGVMVEVFPADVHSKSGNKKKINIPEYLRSVNYSTCMLKGLALQLCDFILWYKYYLREHGDKEINATKWEIKKPDALNFRKQ